MAEFTAERTELIQARNLQKPRSWEEVARRANHLSENAYLAPPVSQQLSAGFMYFRYDDQSSAATERGEDNRKLPLASQIRERLTNGGRGA